MDKDNFWVRLYDDPNNLVRVYQVSDGTWTQTLDAARAAEAAQAATRPRASPEVPCQGQKNSASFTITTGSPFTTAAEVRAGAAHDYGGTVPDGCPKRIAAGVDARRDSRTGGAR